MADRRPDAQEYPRPKKQKVEEMSRYVKDMIDIEDGDQGGVSLDPKSMDSPKIKKEGQDSSAKHYKQSTTTDFKNEIDAGIKWGSENDRKGFNMTQGDQASSIMNNVKAEIGDEKTPAKNLNEPKPEALDPRANPYLAHHYEGASESHNGYSNGYGRPANKFNGTSNTSTPRMPRHETNAAMARKAEDGPNNPFNGRPFSTSYFNILKTRRNLPVHAQRSVSILASSFGSC